MFQTISATQQCAELSTLDSISQKPSTNIRNMLASINSIPGLL